MSNKLEIPVRLYRTEAGGAPVLDWEATSRQPQRRSLEGRSSLSSQRIARLILCEMKKRNKHIGSSLDDFLRKEGVLEGTRAVALKETLAWQVQQAMEKDKISKAEMARRMNTSRAALDRLLDPAMLR
jgi:hypothetical protein